VNQTLQWNGSSWVCATIGGAGTITGVTAGTDLTGGGTSGTVTLNVDTTKVAQLKTANSFTGNQTVSGSVTATSFSGNGAAITSVNASQLGGLASGAFAQLAASNTYSGTQTINNSVSVTSTLGTAAMNVNNTGTGNGIQASANDGYAVGGFASGMFPSNGVIGRFSGASSIGLGAVDIGVWGDSTSGTGVLGTSDNSNAIVGSSTNGSGVYGSSSSSTGVYGTSNSFFGVTGVSSSSSGIWGISSAVAGIYGEYTSGSASGSGFTAAGVWGDSGNSGSFGVLGTTDDGNSLFGKNNTVNHETLYVENDSGFSNGNTPFAARFAGNGASTYCYIARDLNDNGTGDLVCTGSKSAAVAVDGNRMVRLYAVEAADNWFEDAGSSQLANGSAAVALDGVFAQTVNGDVDYHVFITPNGECEGLYVTHKSARGFEVHELHGGHANIAFDYRIMARRKGFENTRMQDVTEDFARMKAESEALAVRVDARKQEEKAHPKMEIPILPKRAPSSSPSGTPKPVLPVTAKSLMGSVK